MPRMRGHFDLCDLLDKGATKYSFTAEEATEVERKIREGLSARVAVARAQHAQAADVSTGSQSNPMVVSDDSQTPPPSPARSWSDVASSSPSPVAPVCSPSPVCVQKKQKISMKSVLTPPRVYTKSTHACFISKNCL